MLNKNKILFYLNIHTPVHMTKTKRGQKQPHPEDLQDATTSNTMSVKIILTYLNR